MCIQWCTQEDHKPTARTPAAHTPSARTPIPRTPSRSAQTPKARTPSRSARSPIACTPTAHTLTGELQLEVGMLVKWSCADPADRKKHARSEPGPSSSIAHRSRGKPAQPWKPWRRERLRLPGQFSEAKLVCDEPPLDLFAMREDAHSGNQLLRAVLLHRARKSQTGTEGTGGAEEH